MRVTDIFLGVAEGGGSDLSPDGKTLYFVERAVGEVSKLNLQTGALSLVRSGFSHPEDVEVDWTSGEFFVSEGAGKILKIGIDGRVGEIANPGGSPRQLALVRRARLRFLFVVCFESGRLIRINLATSATNIVATGLGRPTGLAIDKGANFAYVTGLDSGVLLRVDLANGATSTVYSGLSSPAYLIFDQTGHALYCVQGDPTNSLVKIELGPPLFVTTVASGLAERASAVASASDGKTIYVTADQKVQAITFDGSGPHVPQFPSTLEIASVRFNTGGTAAVPLKRQSTGLPIELPEYIRDLRNEPAAFVCESLVRVQVVFRKLPGFTPGRYALGATGSHGGVRRRTIFLNFDNTGLSSPIEFELMAQLPARVRKEIISFDWQARSMGGAVFSAGSTAHTIFLLIGPPTDPWQEELPWVEGLEIACDWAAGVSSADAAASAITQRFYESGTISYDYLYGATYYGYDTFAFSQMIERLNGGIGLGGRVNCTDTANTVATLANLIGCDLWESTIESNFAVNPVLMLGLSSWEVPFGWGFAYHEVAWKGACTENDNVFDGCLRIDGDIDPSTAPHTPLSPTNILFGGCSALNYRLRLCPPTEEGCTRCVPQPGSRTRRPVI